VDQKLLRIKELIIEKERIDAELDSLIAGAPPRDPKPRVCKRCGVAGHRANKCPQNSAPPEDKQ
jgi:Zinc knuckle